MTNLILSKTTWLILKIESSLEEGPSETMALESTWITNLEKIMN